MCRTLVGRNEFGDKRTVLSRIGGRCLALRLQLVSERLNVPFSGFESETLFGSLLEELVHAIGPADEPDLLYSAFDRARSELCNSRFGEELLRHIIEHDCTRRGGFGMLWRCEPLLTDCIKVAVFPVE